MRGVPRLPLSTPTNSQIQKHLRAAVKPLKSSGVPLGHNKAEPAPLSAPSPVKKKKNIGWLVIAPQIERIYAIAPFEHLRGGQEEARTSSTSTEGATTTSSNTDWEAWDKTEAVNFNRRLLSWNWTTTLRPAFQRKWGGIMITTRQKPNMLRAVKNEVTGLMRSPTPTGKWTVCRFIAVRTDLTNQGLTLIANSAFNPINCCIT